MYLPIVRSNLICASFLLIFLWDCQLSGADIAKKLIFVGGKIEEAIPSNGAELRTVESLDYSFRLNALSLHEGPRPGQTIAVRVYVAVINHATADVTCSTRYGGSARMHAWFMGFGQEGSGTFSKTLTAGEYDFVVMSFGQVDDSVPKLLDVRATCFRVIDAAPKEK